MTPRPYDDESESEPRCAGCPTRPGVRCARHTRGHRRFCELVEADPAGWGPRVARASEEDAERAAGGGQADAEAGAGAGAGAGARAPEACAFFGAPARDGRGRPATRPCVGCGGGGKVRLKLYECRHPGHAGDPMTTLADCARCPDHTPPGRGTLPVKMVAPSEKRPVWRGGILQVMVTRACDLACHHCTQGSNLAGKPVVMTPEEFERAVDSLEGYFGVVGMFGGNPATSPHFGAYCEVLRAKVPFERRGLWCNHPRGKGTLARITFNPAVSNLNVHLSPEAHAEFARDWPESTPFLKGLEADSVHGAPFVAMRDVVPDEAERWKLIGDCDVNKFWSALIGVVPGRGLRAYFCELAYAQAALHATASDAEDWPDTGLAVEPGWWRRPMADFEAQVRLHCHACGIPLRRPGRLAIGGEGEEFSETHRAIARPKARGRAVEVVQIGGRVERPDRPATEYLQGTTPRGKG